MNLFITLISLAVFVAVPTLAVIWNNRRAAQAQAEISLFLSAA